MSMKKYAGSLGYLRSSLLMGAIVAFSGGAANAGESSITLIQLSDLHGNLIPHAGVIDNIDGTHRYVTRAGGLAKTKTVINRIRAENPNSLLLMVGDTTQGSAEVMFTVGDAILPALNTFGIDAFTPGNWDFSYGPAVTRGHYSKSGFIPPVPPQVAVAANQYDGPGLTKTNYPTLAINLYNDNAVPDPFKGQRVWEPYKIFTVDGKRIAVIGITSPIVANQNAIWTIGLRFSQGVVELPGILAEVIAQEVDLVVVQSELGLAQNIQIGREFKGIDVILSAHTHEVTLGAIVATPKEVYATEAGAPLNHNDLHKLNHDGGAIVVEAGEDLYLGRLDLELDGSGSIKSAHWAAIPVDDEVDEDLATAALVAHAEEPFVAGADGTVQRHSFIPGGFCPNNQCGDTTKRGLQLVDDLNTVVGATDVLLERHDVLEGVMNNFLADGVLETMKPLVTTIPGWEGRGADMFSMTNGFRFDTPVLPAHLVPAGKSFFDGRAPGQVTLRDLYAYFPVPSAVAVAEFSGATLQKSFTEIIDRVFDRNPYRQAGGWYVSISNNMRQKIDLVNRPGNSTESRIVETTMNGETIDASKTYVFISCYSHGFELGHICRTPGGFNTKFFEVANTDDYNSTISVVGPKNTTRIIQGSAIKQVAPDRYLHPVVLMRRYLDTLPGRTITETQFGKGRIQHVNSLLPGNPLSAAPVNSLLPELVQPVEGAGPQYLGRTVITSGHGD